MNRRRRKSAARRRLRSAAYILLLAVLACSFLSSIDGPIAQLNAAASAASYSKSAGDAGTERGLDVPLCPGSACRLEPPAVPMSYLRFDFKQNLRRWPVLAGDISRSPPFLP